MKPLRFVLLSVLVTGLALTAWLLLTRSSSPAADCAPGDIDCIGEALEQSVGKTLAERSQILTDASRVAPNPEAVCGAYGYRIGSQSSDPVTDLDTLLRPNSTIGCKSAIIAGVLAAWTAASPTENDLSLVLGRCVGSSDPLCAEAVAHAAAATLQPGPAVETCYRLDPSMRRNCVSNFLFGIRDKQALPGEGDDPREAVVVFCVYWPVDRPVEDCYSAAGMVFYVPVVESALPGALDGLAEAAAFCDRFGEGSLACQAAGYPLAVYFNLAGAPGSESRRAYCGFVDERLFAGCLSLKSDQPPAVG